MHSALLPVDEVDDFIIVRAIAFTSKVQRAVVRDVLREERLPVLEWRLLFSVARFGSCHLAYITRRTSIDPAHGSRAVHALEKKGLISRQNDPNSKRRKLISLTRSGMELVDRIWPKARRTIKTITDQLEPQDFAEIKRLLDLLNAAADPLQEATSLNIDTETKDKEYPRTSLA